MARKHKAQKTYTDFDARRHSDRTFVFSCTDPDGARLHVWIYPEEAKDGDLLAPVTHIHKNIQRENGKKHTYLDAHANANAIVMGEFRRRAPELMKLAHRHVAEEEEAAQRKAAAEAKAERKKWEDIARGIVHDFNAEPAMISAIADALQKANTQ